MIRVRILLILAIQLCQSYDVRLPRSIKARIVGGIQLVPGEAPFLVRMRIKANLRQKPRGSCGGSIISKTWILTAAHCCAKNKLSNKGLNPKLVSFEIGTIKDRSCKHKRGRCDMRFDTNFDPVSEIIQAFKIRIHPSYEFRQMDNDYCLVQTEAMGIDETDQISAIAIPENHLEFKPEVDSCYVAGWGSFDNDRNWDQSYTAKKVALNLIDHEKCQINYKGNAIIDEKYEFCAVGKIDGEDSCGGDSGGPLFCIKNDELILYGIVSYGGHICGNAKEPGVYAKVASVNSWILQYVKDAEVFSNSNKEISTTFDPNQERTATTHLITTNTVTTTTPLITNTEAHSTAWSTEKVTTSTTTTTTTKKDIITEKVSISTCTDSHKHCSAWKISGECRRNPPYMNVNCKKSCGACNFTCGDSHQDCASWKNYGYCTSHKVYMDLNCRKSCNLCNSSMVSANHCSDSVGHCAYWSQTGECHRNAASYPYMRENCRKSCHFCH